MPEYVSIGPNLLLERLVRADHDDTIASVCQSRAHLVVTRLAVRFVVLRADEFDQPGGSRER